MKRAGRPHLLTYYSLCPLLYYGCGQTVPLPALERAFKGSPELEVLQLVHQEDGNAAQIKLDVRLLFSFL